MLVLLRNVARFELVSLIVLFANLATANRPAVAALVGPLHGCAYLFVLLSVLRTAEADTRTKLLAVIPGVGGLLALRRLGRVARGNLAPGLPKNRA